MQAHFFDIDGTIIQPFMTKTVKRPYEEVNFLPNVRERLAALRAQGTPIALITNQGGVAWGFQTEAMAVQKFKDIAAGLGFQFVEVVDGTITTTYTTNTSHQATGLESDTLTVCVCYADSKANAARYADDRRRKPSPAMIREACDMFTADTYMYIGDREEDQAAARAAGVQFTWAQEFFV